MNFVHKNVLESDEIRQGIKEYRSVSGWLGLLVNNVMSLASPHFTYSPLCTPTCSGWPTIPQLFVSGEFVGGCDIVTQMHQNGDLEQLLDTHQVKVA